MEEGNTSLGRLQIAIQQLEVNGMGIDQIEILLADEWITCVTFTEYFKLEEGIH